jgi:hypothetical protein
MLRVLNVLLGVGRDAGELVDPAAATVVSFVKERRAALPGADRVRAVAPRGERG